jgi:hypothetical protein
VAGGIDAVTDLAMGDNKHVVYMENLDVRGGVARPFNLPKINPNVTVPDGSVQVFSYRGRLIFSTKRRNYTAEFTNSHEIIYWTEYGGNPMKMVDGIAVSLGIPNPSSAPIVAIGNAVAPTNIQIAITVGTPGASIPKNTQVSFRLAYRTALGVFPASGAITTTTSQDNSGITLSWGNPSLDIPALETLIFIGTGNKDERYLTSIPAKRQTFAYLSPMAASGEMATLYDQTAQYQYSTTWLRDVDGVQNESGPSSLSAAIQAFYARHVTIDPWFEGFLDSPNLVTWTTPNQPTFEFIAGSELSGSGSDKAISVSSIVVDTDTGRVLCTFATPHYFCNGERILIVGCSPDPFEGLPVEIQVEDGQFTSCYLVVGTSFAAPGASLVGVSAYRVMSVGIVSMAYSSTVGAIVVTADRKHTFGAERVLFQGLKDPNWSDQQIDVFPDIENAYRFYVKERAMPSGLTGNTGITGAMASRALTAINYATTGATGTLPVIDDILYFNMSTTGATGAVIKTAYAVLAAPQNALLVNASIPGATASGGPVYNSGIQFIPHNDYITRRRIYRIGGTELAQLVKELKLDDLSFLDAIPDAGLGQVIPTLFTQDDIDVVVNPAPFGLAGLTQHYAIGFGWDPASNRLRVSLTNNLDAWPPEIYFDFDHRILALKSFNQALCVFCEDGVYRVDGTSPTALMLHKTKAAPCRAGGSVQFLNNSLIYLSDEGLMAFDGNESQCLTDLKIPPDFWLGNSRYLDNRDPGEYLVPFVQNSAFERLRGNDLPSVTPRCLMPYLAQHGVAQNGIRSFVRYGKYFLYWAGDYPQYAAQTMICVDFSAEGSPISVIGIKAMDAFVDELEQVHMILSHPSKSITWDCPATLHSPDNLGTLFVTVTGGGTFHWTIDSPGPDYTFLADPDGNPTMTVGYYNKSMNYHFNLSCLVDGITLLTQNVEVQYP